MSTRNIIWCTGLTVLIGYGVRTRLRDATLTIDEQHEIIVHTLYLILLLWWLLPYAFDFIAPPPLPKPARPKPMGGFGYSFNLDDDEEGGGDVLKLLLFVGAVGLGAYLFLRIPQPVSNIATPQATDFTGYLLDTYFAIPTSTAATQIPNLDAELSLATEGKPTRFGAYLQTLKIPDEKKRKRMEEEIAKYTGVDRLMVYLYYLNWTATAPVERDRELVPLYLLLFAYQCWDVQGFTKKGFYIEKDGKRFPSQELKPPQVAPYQVYTYDAVKKTLSFQPANVVFLDAFRIESYKRSAPPPVQKTYTLAEIGEAVGTIFPHIIQRTFPEKECWNFWVTTAFCNSFPARPTPAKLAKVDDLESSSYLAVKEPFGQWRLPQEQ